MSSVPNFIYFFLKCAKRILTWTMANYFFSISLVIAFKLTKEYIMFQSQRIKIKNLLILGLQATFPDQSDILDLCPITVY